MSVSKKLQRQTTTNLASNKLPPRGTGRKTGTAKKPTGPSGRLTEEERKKRHEKMVK